MAAISAALRGIGGGAAGGAAAGGAAGATSEAVAGLNGQLGNLADTGEQAGNAFGDLQKQLSGVTGGSNLATLAFGQLDKALNTVTGLTNKYVAAFAPAEADLFSQALRDLNAVIGEQLVPVTRAARDVIRYVADGFATFTPIVRGFLEDVIGRVRPAFESLGEAFESLLPRVMPLVQLFGEVLAVGIEAVARPLELVADLFTYLSEALNDLLGLPKVDLADSRGKAIAGTSTTSVGGFLGKAQQNAFAMGVESPEQKTVSILDQIREKLATLPNDVAAAAVQKLSESAIGRALLNAAEKGQGVVNFASGVADGFTSGPRHALNQIPKFNEIF